MENIIFKELDIRVAALRQTNVASETAFQRYEDTGKLKNQPKEMVKFFTR